MYPILNSVPHYHNFNVSLQMRFPRHFLGAMVWTHQIDVLLRSYYVCQAFNVLLYLSIGMRDTHFYGSQTKEQKKSKRVAFLPGCTIRFFGWRLPVALYRWRSFTIKSSALADHGKYKLDWRRQPSSNLYGFKIILGKRRRRFENCLTTSAQ